MDHRATRVGVIEEGILIAYLGISPECRKGRGQIVLDLPVTLQVKGTAKEPAGRAKPAAPISPSRAGGKKGVKTKFRTVEDVERDVEKAEAHVKALEDELNEAALNADAAQLTQLSADYEQAKSRVEELLVEWEQLAGAPS